MEIINKPLRIEDSEVCLYGIYRGIVNPSKIVIFIPAITGTRVGPQRMFVEIANHLNKQSISTICFDLPTAGDSIDKKNIRFSSQRAYYHYFLSKIYDFTLKEYPASDIIFISISVGCIPVLEISEKNRLNKVVLLSPNHLSNNSSVINKQNIYAYFLKLFQMKTWEKLFLLRLNFFKITSNMFNINKNGKKRDVVGDSQITASGKVNLLCIFGENDPELKENQRYWDLNRKKNRFINYKECIVSNSDHSFMGWNSKNELLSQISNWLN